MTISLQGLGPLITETVLDVQLADGRRAEHLLRSDTPSWEIPLRDDGAFIAWQYVRLGIAHIASGADHLLFLLLLVLTLKKPRAVILAETAFTLSHSLSFTATALGWVRVSPAATEACIALSLVLVALDLGDKAMPAWRGAGLALTFGLVHGLGFAGGLREIGLPEQHVPQALLGFGAGVELGQIAFLALALAAVHFLSRAASWPRVALALGYGAGSIASFWLIQRLWVCFEGAFA